MYVYVTTKLEIKEGLTEEEIQEIIENMDYSFEHPQILETEILDCKAEYHP